VRSQAPGDDIAPVPTFTNGPEQTTLPPTPEPTPTETSSSPAEHDRSEERFLTVDSGIMWRGVAGECGAVAPLLERSTDSGETWIDVTPLYLDVGQLMGVAPFADGQAEILAAVGSQCEVQALRTFTQGQFWAPYDDVLAGAEYVAPEDGTSVVLSGAPEPAPCSDARSLRADTEMMALVCEGSAYARGSDAWTALPAEGATTLALDGADVIVAHSADDCEGLALTRYVGADGDSSEDAGCLADVDADAPTTIAISDGEVFAWSADSLSITPF